MLKIFLFLSTVFSLSCKSTTYYIVRHAEKDTSSTNMMTSDVPLSEMGKQRAKALKNSLQGKAIKYIFSTNYIRTKSTAQPLADAIKVPVEIYDPKDSGFINKLKSLSGNALIVGHSNTVDDLVNELAGKKEIKGDLQDSEYGDLFIVKKNGSKLTFEKKHFGQ